MESHCRPLQHLETAVAGRWRVMMCQGPNLAAPPLLRVAWVSKQAVQSG